MCRRERARGRQIQEIRKSLETANRVTITNCHNSNIVVATSIDDFIIGLKFSIWPSSISHLVHLISWLMMMMMMKCTIIFDGCMRALLCAHELELIPFDAFVMQTQTQYQTRRERQIPFCIYIVLSCLRTAVSRNFLQLFRSRAAKQRKRSIFYSVPRSSTPIMQWQQQQQSPPFGKVVICYMA